MLKILTNYGGIGFLKKKRSDWEASKCKQLRESERRDEQVPIAWLTGVDDLRSSRLFVSGGNVGLVAQQAQETEAGKGWGASIQSLLSTLDCRLQTHLSNTLCDPLHRRTRESGWDEKASLRNGFKVIIAYLSNGLTLKSIWWWLSSICGIHWATRMQHSGVCVLFQEHVRWTSLDGLCAEAINQTDRDRRQKVVLRKSR